MNIVLIGMPGAGKSTIGPALAEKTGRCYVDTDHIIKENTGRELKDIVIEDGYEVFLEIQEKTILEIRLKNTVIATGGSVVCSKAAVEHLKSNGLFVYLRLDFSEIERRLSPERRLARSSGKTLYEIYCERAPLYEKYADIPVDCSGLSVDEIVSIIIENNTK